MEKDTGPRAPSPRQTTVRKALADALRGHGHTAHQLSQIVGIPEKLVAGHLAHIARSLPGGGERLAVSQPTCLVCGYVFAGRVRLTRPSRCPECRATHLSDPVFSIRPAGKGGEDR